MAKVIFRGLAPPDDPVYSRGLRVRGAVLPGSKKVSQKSEPVDLNLKRVVKELTDEAYAALDNPGGGSPKIKP